MPAELVRSPLFGVALTLAVYALAERLYLRVRTPLAHPVAVSIVTIIATLVLLAIPHDAYAVGGKLLLFLLGPAVVALAVPLYDQRARLAGRALPIFAGILAGAFTSIVTAVGTARLLGASGAVAMSLAPKSVTTPIAIALAERVGGIPPLTACVVVLTGCLGAVGGPELCRALGIREPVAMGLAMGTACHGIGTARMLEIDALAGAVSGLAIGLNGIATSVILPLVLRVIG